MLTSLIEILELPNFGYMTTPAMYFESRENTKYLYFKKA